MRISVAECGWRTKMPESEELAKWPQIPPRAWRDKTVWVVAESIEELQDATNEMLETLNDADCHIHDIYQSPTLEYTVMIWYSYPYEQAS